MLGLVIHGLRRPLCAARSAMPSDNNMRPGGELPGRPGPAAPACAGLAPAADTARCRPIHRASRRATARRIESSGVSAAAFDRRRFPRPCDHSIHIVVYGSTCSLATIRYSIPPPQYRTVCSRGQCSLMLYTGRVAWMNRHQCIVIRDVFAHGARVAT